MTISKYARFAGERLGWTPRCVLSLAILVLASASAVAEPKYEKSDDAVYPEPAEGKALVYLLRPHWEFLRSIPALEFCELGYLPTRSYIAVQRDPGPFSVIVIGTDMTLFGSKFEGVTMTLEAGRTYIFELEETHNAYGIVKSSWTELDVSELRKRVEEKSLRYVTMTEKGRKALREACDKRSETTGHS